MSKIGVIGDNTSVLGFKAFGLDAFPARGADEAREILSRIAREDYGIIYITESLCRDMAEDIARYTSEKTPAVIPIPGADGNFGIGMAGVKRAVERAVGADILFGGEA